VGEKTKTEYLNIQLADGAITIEEYRAELGMPPLVSVAEATQSIEDKIANAQVELRGTVGGVQGLIELNASVSRNEISRNSAIAILVNVYGFDSSTAASMVTG